MRTYRTVNLVILGLLLYVLFFSLISPYMERIFPTLWRCNYKALTGEQCPFCGLTGDMRNYLFAGRQHAPINPYFPEYARLYLGILLLRTVFIIASFRYGSKHLPQLDAIVHLVFLLTVFLT